jgi:ankyrin repeat protein
MMDCDDDGSIRCLRTRAPDVLSLQDSSGRTPLHLLLSNNNRGVSRLIDLISFIMKANPNVLTVRDNQGFTPLHTACSDGIAYYHASDFGHIRSLVTRALDILVLQDSSGCTPLHLLLRNEWLVRLRRGSDAVDSLIIFIVKANPKVLTVRDSEGFTPLLVASQLKLPLNIIYSMLRFDPQSNLSSSWFF